MVTIFTLGLGFASGVFFAFGGYWNTLLGAFVCLWASILDGCDGEVARLKLQESAFDCWLETVCDYLFYLFLFVGMTLGLWRSSGSGGANGGFSPLYQIGGAGVLGSTRFGKNGVKAVVISALYNERSLFFDELLRRISWTWKADRIFASCAWLVTA